MPEQHEETTRSTTEENITHQQHRDPAEEKRISPDPSEKTMTETKSKTTKRSPSDKG